MKNLISAAFGLATMLAATQLVAGTITLDFEDGALPSASGWQPALLQSGTATHTVISGSVPGVGGNNILRSSARDYFGWYLDLSGLIEDEADWTFSLDFRRVSSTNFGGGGINDIGITKYGDQSQQMNIGGITDTAWHTFEMSYSSASGQHAAAIDGTAVASSAPGLFPATVPDPTNNYLTFAFGNRNVVKVAEFDNLTFTFENPAPVPVPASILFGLTGLAVLGGVAGKGRKQRRSAAT